MQGLLFKDTLKRSNSSNSNTIDELYDDLLNLFSVTEDTNSISIIDPQIDYGILSEIEGSSPEYGNDSLWTLLIKEFALKMQAGNISIISSGGGIPRFNSNNWLRFRSSNIFPSLSNFIHEDNNVIFAAYYWNEQKAIYHAKRQNGKSFPRRLHDRYIIIDEQGWQIGMDLNHITQKDLLITEMDSHLVLNCKSRFDEMIDTSSTWKENRYDE